MTRPAPATLVRGWMVFVLLVGTMAYAIAEEITLTTYYPSPRGVYDQLRTAGNMQIGSIEPSGLFDPDVPRLHIVGDGIHPAFRVDDAQIAAGAPSPPLASDYDSTPFIIDQNGNVGIGASPDPAVKLDVAGLIRPMRANLDPPAELSAGGAFYYNTVSKGFRLFRDGQWRDGVAGGVVRRQGTNPTCDLTVGEVRLARRLNSFTVNWGDSGVCNYGMVTCDAVWTKQETLPSNCGTAPQTACQALCNRNIGCESCDPTSNCAQHPITGSITWGEVVCAVPN